MKRMHVHIAVADIAASISFYTGLFAAQPSVQKNDYAKWVLDDPQLNFAISAREAHPGIEHLGIEADSDVELAGMYARLERVAGPVLDEGATVCCYARSRKRWVEDPQGVRWETFLTTGESTVYGDATPPLPADACCAPLAVATQRATAAPCCSHEQRARAVTAGADCCS